MAHKKYDCSLSFKDLTALQCTIDLKNNLDINYYEDINDFSINVNVKDGNVLVPSIRINENIILPESICKAKNYKVFLPIEINNIATNEILPVTPLENYLEVQQMEENESNSIKINEIIRTNHMNEEEKSAIIKLCYKYKNVFFYPKRKINFVQFNHTSY